MEISALHGTVCMVETKINLQQNVSIIDIFNLVLFIYVSNSFYSHERTLFCTDFLRPLSFSRHGLVEEQLENE